MCDGWSKPTRRRIVNFIIYFDRLTFFHRSIGASNKVCDADYILGLMIQVICEVGKGYDILSEDRLWSVI